MSHNIEVESGKTIRLPTAGKYCERDILVTAKGGGQLAPTQEKTVNITENGTVEVVPDNGYVLSKVTANVNIPPVEILLQDKFVTPTEEEQEIIPDEGYTGIGYVFVHPIPSEYVRVIGTTEIIENGEFDVKEVEKVIVNVPIPDGYIKPSGTLEITENGEYDVTKKASVVVSIEASGGGSSDLARQIFEARTFSDESTTEVPVEGFRGWQFIQHIDMPNVTSIGQSACYNCVGLQEIDFPNCTNIGNYAFYNNTSVTRVNLPNLKSTGTNCLRQLTALKEVTLPSLSTLGGTAFQKCTSLERVDLPTVQSIGANAFNLCEKLVTLILRSDSLCTMANVNALASTPIKSGTGFIYVKDSLVDTYKSASNWSTYASQIKGLSELVE